MSTIIINTAKNLDLLLNAIQQQNCIAYRENETIYIDCFSDEDTLLVSSQLNILCINYTVCDIIE